MTLDDTQKTKVAGWIAEGLNLSGIQKRLASEFSIHLTYMEVRLLVDDLKLTPRDPERATSVDLRAGATPPGPPKQDTAPVAEEDSGSIPEPPGAGTPG